MRIYPVFRQKIENSIETYIHSNTPKCIEHILALVDMQSVYINATDDDLSEAKYVIV